MAGEYVAHFETHKIDKGITIYSPGPLLAGFPHQAGVIAENFFKARNVQIKRQHFDFKASSPDTLVIDCSGYKYRTEFMKDDFADCL